MAKNNPIGDNARKGSVKKRTQVYIKRDSTTGQFIDVKTSGGKFKGVRREK